MGEENENKQGLGSKVGNIAKEQTKEAAKKQTKKAAKKLMSKFSKKATQKAATASMKGPLMMIMLKVLLVILIIMAIIGILVFLFTMPGMVMEKLKALAKAIGNGIASWFGGDQTKLNAEDTKVYEILTYLEQMGYDLKGEGFLTDEYTADDIPDDKESVWEPDVNENGVIRNKEDDKIVMADSLFVYNYLVSDNYVYTVKNFNMTTDDSNGYQWWDAFQAIGGRILNLFNNTGSKIWGRGLISLWHEDGQIGKVDRETGFYGNGIFHWEDIKVDASAKTLSIRRGWGSNKMVYNLDGWTGRYGMPLEFLLSVHLATKMPDLAYDMTKVFGGQNSDEKGTEIEIILHPLENVEAITGYKKDFPTDGGEYITYNKMKELKGEGWSPTDGWTLSKKEAAQIMKLGIQSPEGCTYKDPTYEILDHSDNGDGWILDDDKLAELQGYGFKDSEFEDIESELGKKAAKKTEEKFTVREAMAERKDEKSMGTKGDSAKSFGYNYETVKSQGGYYISGPEKFNGKECFEGTCDKKSHIKSIQVPEGSSLDDYALCGHTIGVQVPWEMYMKKNTYYQVHKYVVEREWQANYDGKEDVCFTWVSYVYKIYKFKDKKREGNGEYVKSYIFDYIMRDLTFEELVEKGILNEDGSAVKEQRCSNDKNLEECCSTCKNHVKKAMKLMKDANDPEFDTYTPYISKVKNHWYRDVYFVQEAGKDNFVQVDEEYEALMGERWTLYETDDNGQYVLYVLGENGNYATSENDANVKKAKEVKEVEKKGNYYVFLGTQQDATEGGVPVVKKAETIKITDTDDDGNQLINWQKNGGIWSAYKLNEQEESTGWQPLYETSESEDGEKTTEEKLKERIFLKITTQGDIVQVEEGQRTETNPEIRNMFLNNTYFRYDGSPETAEKIAKLREKISGDDLKFGNLTDSDLGKLTDEEKKYTGKVELTQNSLSAFSMLENTHTIDADFIYKDFKELVVELGYFTKEELSDETPRIFAWMIPEIGSYGYPIASLDKKENEYGTQAHSKADYEANEKNTLRALIQEMSSEIPEEISAQQTSNVTSVTRGLFNIADNFDTTEIGAINEAEKKVSQVSIDEFLQTTREMCEYINKEGYDYCVLTGSGCHHDAHSNSCGLPTTFEASKESVGKHNMCCATLVSWALQNVKVMPDSAHLDGANTLAQWIADNLDAKLVKENEEIQPGDILCYKGTVTNNTISGMNHIDLVGEKTEGGFVKYNGGGYAQVGAQEFGKASCIEKITGTTPGTNGASFALRLNWGNSSGGGEAYEGYEGGEAVVSPVTGILLEYGKYKKGEVDPITGKESRVNVDFKYIDKNNTTEETELILEPTSSDVIDYVGYAKIMVLDDETYLELEKQMKSSATKALSGLKDKEKNTVNSLVDKDGNYLENSALKTDEIFSDDESKKWSEDDITLYGYKEFAELYSKFGVSGNIIYIDGFECELPNESEESEEKSEDEEPKDKNLKGETINLEHFKSKANDNEYDKVVYEKEDRYNLSSKDATNKLNNENDIKAEADPLIMVGDKLLIKEGTVIGRTLSNEEVVKQREANGIATPKAKEETKDSSTSDTGKKEENKDPVIGNYLRIIMRDDEDIVVENIEEYMKLDEVGQKSEQTDGYSVIGTLLSESEWVQKVIEYATQNGGDAIFKSETDMKEFYNICVNKGVNPEWAFLKAIQEQGLKASDGNYWGLGVYNGSSGKSWGDWKTTLEKFCDTLVEYQDPASPKGYYDMIMEQYERRKNCTDNGGCDPLGYGKPDTAQGVQSIYSNLGKHEYGSPGSGGYYYMDPDRAGVTKIYATHDEFVSKCLNVDGEHTEGNAVTIWENNQFTAYQIEQIITLGKEIFGEKAGKYSGK